MKRYWKSMPILIVSALFFAISFADYGAESDGYSDWGVPIKAKTADTAWWSLVADSINITSALVCLSGDSIFVNKFDNLPLSIKIDGNYAFRFGSDPFVGFSSYHNVRLFGCTLYLQDEMACSDRIYHDEFDTLRIDCDHPLKILTPEIMLLNVEGVDKVVIEKHRPPGRGIINMKDDVLIDSTLTVNGDVSVSGAVMGRFQEIVIAETGDVTAAQMRGTLINNYGQSAASTLTLPVAAVGLNCQVVVITTGFALHIDCQGTDRFFLDGVALPDGNRISNTVPAVGDGISIMAVRTGATSYDWIARTIQGTWVDGG